MPLVHSRVKSISSPACYTSAHASHSGSNSSDSIIRRRRLLYGPRTRLLRWRRSQFSFSVDCHLSSFRQRPESSLADSLHGSVPSTFVPEGFDKCLPRTGTTYLPSLRSKLRSVLAHSRISFIRTISSHWSSPSKGSSSSCFLTVLVNPPLM